MPASITMIGDLHGGSREGEGLETGVVRMDVVALVNVETMMGPRVRRAYRWCSLNPFLPLLFLLTVALASVLLAPGVTTAWRRRRYGDIVFDSPHSLRRRDGGHELDVL